MAFRKLGLIGALLASGSAGAEVYEMHKCTPSEGKTIADVQQSIAAYRDWARESGKVMPKSDQLMFEFFGEDREANGFYRMLVFDDFAEHGTALNERWDLGGVVEYQQHSNMSEPPWHCSQIRVFWAPSDSVPAG